MLGVLRHALPFLLLPTHFFFFIPSTLALAGDKNGIGGCRICSISLSFRADAHLSRLVVSSRRWEIGVRCPGLAGDRTEILKMADEPRPGLCS